MTVPPIAACTEGAITDPDLKYSDPKCDQTDRIVFTESVTDILIGLWNHLSYCVTLNAVVGMLFKRIILRDLLSDSHVHVEWLNKYNDKIKNEHDEAVKVLI